MARVDGIKRRLLQRGLSESQIKDITGNGDLTGIISRMDESLDSGIVRQVLDSCGCLGSQEYRKKLENTGRALAGKSINEKTDYINNMGSGSESIVCNGDNTLTVTMKYDKNGKCKCVCSASVKKGVTVSDLASEENSPDGSVMPLSYCFCCAGSFRRHLQLQLGVELQTKEIISSPINSKGEKPCEFIFEVVG